MENTKKSMRIIGLLLLFIGILFSSCNNKKNTNDSVNKQGEVVAEPNKEDQIIKADYEVLNGEKATAYKYFEETADFSTLSKALKMSFEEKSVTNSVGPFTILSPINAAFANLPKDTLNKMFNPKNKKWLAYLLNNHLALENYSKDMLIKEAKAGRNLYVESSEYLPIEVKGNEVYVDGAKILKQIKIGNSWILVIDKVIMPNPKYLKIPKTQNEDIGNN